MASRECRKISDKGLIKSILEGDVKNEEVIRQLKALSRPETIAGMARFGITPKNTYGVSIPNLRGLAKEMGKDHNLDQQLWKRDNRETRILASMIEEPTLVTEPQMDRWVMDFDYWEMCDQCGMNLFEKTRFAYKKCVEWSFREEEYVKRAAFVLMARLAVSDKRSDNQPFESFLPIIARETLDDRDQVKKAVNWALRQVGKRSSALNAKAVETAREMQKLDSRSARWVASDALRELTSASVQRRLKS